jgi:hypothetical protein
VVFYLEERRAGLSETSVLAYEITPVCFTPVYLTTSTTFHHFVIYAPLIFALTLFGWFVFVYLSSFCGNIFDLRLPDLRPLFEEHNNGVKEGLGVHNVITRNTVFANWILTSLLFWDFTQRELVVSY